VEARDWYFETQVVTELIEQEYAVLREWIDRRKQMINHFRNSTKPPDDDVRQLLVMGDEVWRRLGEINRLAVGREATFPPLAAETCSGGVHPVG